jgi:predicted nucleotidyltransferase
MLEGALEQLVTHYRSRLGDALEGVVLYGSRARGDAHPDSDLDLLLIAKQMPSDPFERARLLNTPRLAAGVPPVSARGLTTDEYERDIAAVDLDIAVDGRILFDSNGYMADRLSLIRQRLQEAGLYRDAELVWRWRSWPKRQDWAITWQGVRV